MSNNELLRKLIDIPVKDLPKLEKAAKEANRSLKNHLETIIIQSVKPNANEKK